MQYLIVTTRCLSQLDYDKHVSFIQEKFQSKKWFVAGITSLMDETAIVRRQWIQKEGPSVKDMFQRFPCLTDSQIVSGFVLFSALYNNSTLIYMCVHR